MIEYKVEVDDNNAIWRLDGKLHREGDLPAIEYENGDNIWYVNGKLHRENDKPAIESTNGYKQWYVNGKHHRTNGAAIEWSDGSKEWYLEGVNYSEEEFNEEIIRLGIAITVKISTEIKSKTNNEHKSFYQLRLKESLEKSKQEENNRPSGPYEFL